MRTIGSLYLKLSLINIPLKVNSFLDYGGVSLKQLCPTCKVPISQKRYCLSCDKEIPFKDLLSGFEISKNNIIVVDKKQLQAELETKIIAIVDKDSEFEFLTEKCYILTSKDVEKPYYLLLNILSQQNKELIIEYSLRKKLHLGVIKPMTVNGIKTLLLKQILYCDSIKDIALKQEISVEKEELEMAMLLFEKIRENIPKVNFLELKDNRKQVLEDMINGKIKPAEQIVKATEDLKTELKKSLEMMTKKEKPKKVS